MVQEDKNGYTFNPYNVEELTQVFRKFVDNPSQIIPFGEKSKEIIKRFSPEQVAEEMYEGFKKVVYEHQ